MLSFVILDKHLSSTKNVPRQAHSALEAAHLVPLLTELYTKLGHPRAPWLMQSCKWCKNTSPKNELLIAMVKAVSDGRLPPLGRKKKKNQVQLGVWAFEPFCWDLQCTSTWWHSTGSPQPPGQAWGCFLSDSLCRCFVKSLKSVCSSPPEVQCTALCIFTVFYFVFSHPSACLSVQLQAPPERNL